jgi:hypothetical protein
MPEEVYASAALTALVPIIEKADMPSVDKLGHLLGVRRPVQFESDRLRLLDVEMIRFSSDYLQTVFEDLHTRCTMLEEKKQGSEDVLLKEAVATQQLLLTL